MPQPDLENYTADEDDGRSDRSKGDKSDGEEDGVERDPLEIMASAFESGEYHLLPLDIKVQALEYLVDLAMEVRCFVREITQHEIRIWGWEGAACRSHRTGFHVSVHLTRVVYVVPGLSGGFDVVGHARHHDDQPRKIRQEQNYPTLQGEGKSSAPLDGSRGALAFFCSSQF